MMTMKRRGIKLQGALRRGLSFALTLCLLLSAAPQALAASSVGSRPSAITPDNAKTYIQLTVPTVFFTGTTYGEGTTVTASRGTVWQLVSENWYTASDGLEYYSVYYNSTVYNVLKSDVENDIMSATDLNDYIVNILWQQPSYDTLKEELNLRGDIRVHGLQVALSRLSYLTGAIDGTYGNDTYKAVYAFQRANGLDRDGRAGPITQAALYAMARGSSSGVVSGGTTGSTGSTGSTGTSVTGTLRSTNSVNLRRSATTKSARLAVVPRGTSLSYTATSVVSGITWYQVTYTGLTGWLMGTYVSVGSASSSAAAIGTVTITAGGTRVRTAPNGAKSGTLLAKGSVVDLLASPTTAGGYTWYNIRTSSGLVGYVRGDCATATMGGSSGVTPSTDKTFVRLPYQTELFTTETKPSSGMTNVSAGTVLQMVSTVTYTSGGETYASVYYNNEKYNVVYSDIESGILSDDELAEYVSTLWSGTLDQTMKRSLDLVGDVRVYAMQVALAVLGYYTGSLDGNYGGGSESAVRNYQRYARIEVDGQCGRVTWARLGADALTLSNGGTTGSGGSSSGSGSTGGVTVTDFGTVTSVRLATWSDVDGGSVSLFKRGSTATVMDVSTGRVFTIYRWSGGNHADCVPYTAADTRVMCEIVGMTYNSNHPTSSQLNQIKADEANNNATYTWPDFNNAWGNGRDIGSDWDRRACLLNVDGNVYPVSIYGYPHGFDGTSSFCTSKFPSGAYFYAQNNYYGMMCVHFQGSRTHNGGSVDSAHQNAINTAYSYAQRLWPTLVR